MTAHLEPSEPMIGEGQPPADDRPIAGAGLVTHPGPLPGLAHSSRRLAVGYVWLRSDIDAADSDQLAARLSAFAARSGLHLVDIYTDRHPFRRSAFGALLQALCSPDVNAVVVPAPDHFSEFNGVYQAMRALIELETGADVLVMSQTTEATP
ncbi:hypothetical protein ACFOY2_19380 [Nonomuraea purpurea]|uniref:Recombinase family protein n=1 Tax=Nonomuraea purpurea TaxID=1849276 RepID=A0ABV8G6M8_9ACTN